MTDILFMIFICILFSIPAYEALKYIFELIVSLIAVIYFTIFEKN